MVSWLLLILDTKAGRLLQRHQEWLYGDTSAVVAVQFPCCQLSDSHFQWLGTSSVQSSLKISVKKKQLSFSSAHLERVHPPTDILSLPDHNIKMEAQICTQASEWAPPASCLSGCSPAHVNTTAYASRDCAAPTLMSLSAGWAIFGNQASKLNMLHKA